MSVFEFSDFRDYLRHRLAQDLYAPSGRKRSSLRRVASSIGYSSPSLLSMVINGRRHPSDDLCEALARAWSLSLRERAYLRLLVRLGRARQQGLDPDPIVREMRRIAGHTPIQICDDAAFAAIRDWHFVVIQQLAGSAEFKEDPVWISRALRRKITPIQAQQALEKMLGLGILIRDPETGRLVCRPGRTETSHGVPSAAIRAHHAQMLERAKETINDRLPQERLLNGLTFKVSPQRVPELRERILEFLRSIDEEFSDPSSSSVHQLCVQQFEHTASEPDPSEG